MRDSTHDLIIYSDVVDIDMFYFQILIHILLIHSFTICKTCHLLQEMFALQEMSYIYQLRRLPVWHSIAVCGLIVLLWYSSNPQSIQLQYSAAGIQFIFFYQGHFCRVNACYHRDYLGLDLSIEGQLPCSLRHHAAPLLIHFRFAACMQLCWTGCFGQFRMYDNLYIHVQGKNILFLCSHTSI